MIFWAALQKVILYNVVNFTVCKQDKIKHETVVYTMNAWVMPVTFERDKSSKEI